MQFLSLAECPIGLLPHPDDIESIPTGLNSLNVSTTKIDSWQEVEKLRKFPGLNDLRIQGCPFLDEFTRKEKRMLLVARLPNVTVLNGGDMITKTEREDAERAFIRHFLDTPEELRPSRWQELVDIHGLLDPLVNIDLTPEMNIKVDIKTAICELPHVFVFRSASTSKINAERNTFQSDRQSSNSNRFYMVTSGCPQPT